MAVASALGCCSLFLTGLWNGGLGCWGFVKPPRPEPPPLLLPPRVPLLFVGVLLWLPCPCVFGTGASFLSMVIASLGVLASLGPSALWVSSSVCKTKLTLIAWKTWLPLRPFAHDMDLPFLWNNYKPVNLSATYCILQ